MMRRGVASDLRIFLVPLPQFPRGSQEVESSMTCNQYQNPVQSTRWSVEQCSHPRLPFSPSALQPALERTRLPSLTSLSPLTPSLRQQQQATPVVHPPPSRHSYTYPHPRPSCNHLDAIAFESKYRFDPIRNPASDGIESQPASHAERTTDHPRAAVGAAVGRLCPRPEPAPLACISAAEEARDAETVNAEEAGTGAGCG